MDHEQAMPTVWIPGLLRDLTSGEDFLTVPGETVGQVIENLDVRYPGIRERLYEQGTLRRNIVVVVDGVTSRQRLRHRLTESSEVHFVPAISGG
jgi:molybdopterin converting factor small subunit